MQMSAGLLRRDGGRRSPSSFGMHAIRYLARHGVTHLVCRRHLSDGGTRRLCVFLLCTGRRDYARVRDVRRQQGCLGFCSADSLRRRLTFAIAVLDAFLISFPMLYFLLFNLADTWSLSTCLQNPLCFTLTHVSNDF